MPDRPATLATDLSRRLAALDRRHRRRTLQGRSGFDFASNDYLGLAEGPELKAVAAAAIERGVPIGAGASRLLRGNHPAHEALEAFAAAYFGAESALYFAGGFTANAALIATLPQRGDLIVHDELIHASAHDGMRLAKANTASAMHNDAQAFDDVISHWRAKGGTGRVWIVVESLYSMDGDRAPLVELIAVADRHDGVLIVDEAHATGALGPRGRGLAAHLEGRHNVITLHTCGKAIGVAGGLVCGPQAMTDFLVNRCRPFIYATAPSPLVAAVTEAALRLVGDADDRRALLAARSALVSRRVEAMTGAPATVSHIVPVRLGRDDRALAVAQALQERGYDVRAIRPPTVPEGTARLRLSLTLNVDEATTLALLDAVQTLLPLPAEAVP